MTKPFHLQSLVDLAEERKQSAAQDLAMLKGVLHEAEFKLQQLRSYHEEYRLRLQTQAESGVPIAQLRDYRAFMGKLDVAIRAQAEEVERCRQRWQVGCDHWRERERESKAYQTLRQRHELNERKSENRQDQRLQDEFVNNAHNRKLPPTE